MKIDNIEAFIELVAQKVADKLRQQEETETTTTPRPKHCNGHDFIRLIEPDEP